MNRKFWFNLLKITGVILIITSPFISVYWLVQDSIHPIFDLTNTNTANIGSSIGGMTAPIVGLVGILVVYISFQEQVRANRLIISSNIFDRFNGLYLDIKDDFEKLKYVDNKVPYYGAEAIAKMVSDLSTMARLDHVIVNSYATNRIAKIIASFELLLQKIDADKSLNKLDKEILIEKISMLYIPVFSDFCEQMKIVRGNKILYNLIKGTRGIYIYFDGSNGVLEKNDRIIDYLYRLN